MSRFDPDEYVRMARRAGVGTAMVYACCHNGNCYYPTEVGHRHVNLNGRDIFGETVAGLQAAGMVPLAYYTIVFQNDAAGNHPEWRMRDGHGKEHDGRYWYACINHPDYIEYVKSQLTEIAAYPVAGFFIDMPFWPLVCQCGRCREQYRTETGKEIPQTIDWNSSEWVRFQRARERWMGEAAEVLRTHLKALRPEADVVFNFAPVLHGWLLAQTGAVARASDFTSGDFYGGRHQQRLGCKILAAYSRSMPYEFMTSRCVTLYDHTSTKSEDELVLHALTTLANGGAPLLIDAINPDGTLNPTVYERLHRVAERIDPFRRALEKHRPEPEADCGLYFSPICNVTPGLSGTSLSDYSARESHMDATGGGADRLPVIGEAVGTSRILTRLKIPFRIITETSGSLDGLSTLILNNAAWLPEQQADQIRTFVREGGTLIATGMTSFFTPDGENTGDFQLADVFGVSFSGAFSEAVSYLHRPDDSANPVFSSGKAPLCRATTARVLGTVMQPYYPPGDPQYYASIHSNPPGICTDYAGLTVNAFGKGRCVWLYSSLLKHLQHAQEQVGRRLLAEWIGETVLFSRNLHDAVELTFLRSRTQEALLIGLVNYQEEEPVIPFRDVEIRLRLPGRVRPEAITRISDGCPQPFVGHEDGSVSITLPELRHAEMLEVF